ncbi:hypothetical protein LB518_12995 [Mesorhizobium sp. BR1-1-16]|uniref:DUF2946 family protein n=1 Tax=Mesorhizobium sp. BR1-1-16 TaxID=2876653 RepID=UPI001CC965EA|nr:DUF2946 family protein [Mesorhizobium sp. BR1-1-16]MBZ9937214.1 hypothetical protein [Mesorhizobium sp. BR1-1-16]
MLRRFPIGVTVLAALFLLLQSLVAVVSTADAASAAPRDAFGRIICTSHPDGHRPDGGGDPLGCACCLCCTSLDAAVLLAPLPPAARSAPHALSNAAPMLVSLRIARPDWLPVRPRGPPPLMS